MTKTMNLARRKISRLLAAGSLLAIAPTLLFVAPQARAQVDAIGGPVVVATLPQKIKSAAESTIQTINNVKENISNDVLDALAINAALLAGEKLNNSVYRWISGGFENGRQIFINSTREFLAESGDMALRVGLTAITQTLGEVAFNINRGEGQNELPPNALPDWIIDYLMSAQQIEDNDMAALERLIAGVSIEENPAAYCGGQLFGIEGRCPPGATQLWDDLSPVGSCQVGYPTTRQSSNPEICKASSLGFIINVGLQTGQQLTFSSSGWVSTADAFPKDENGSGAPGQNPAQAIMSSTFTTELANSFGNALTQSAVTAYNSTLSGAVETTLRDQLGPLWLGFANDVTIGYNKFDPYAAWDSLMAPGNNALGSAFTIANGVAVEADRKLQAAIQESTSSGFLPDKTCEEVGVIAFADGTEEEICQLWSTKSPQSLVGRQAGEAVAAAFDVQGTEKWEQLGVKLLADFTSAVVTGGIEAAAGEIRNRGQEVAANIRQLGPFSYLFGEIGNEITAGDDQAWQLLGSRDIDFSDINKQINTTYQEARLFSEAAILLEQTSGPLLVLDQECVFGPDFGWEQRLTNNFKEDVERLDKEIQSRTDSDTNRSEALRRLRQSLDEELARQVSFVNEAMSGNPFRYQFEFMSSVTAAQPQIAQYVTYMERSADKLNALSTLVEIRRLIERLGEDGAMLMQSPPTWEPDIVNVIASGIGDLGGIDINVDRQEITRLRDLDDQESTGQPQFSRPRVSVQQVNLTVPHQEGGRFLFDVTQGVTVTDAEDDQNPNTQNALRNSIFDAGNITITRYADNAIDDPLTDTIDESEPLVLEPYNGIEGDQPGVYYIEQTGGQITGISIDVNETYTMPEKPAVEAVPARIAPNGVVLDPAVPGVPGRPEMQVGYRYVITYTAVDSSGNEAVGRRTIRVKTYDQHLVDLQEYNARLQDYIASIPEAGAAVQARLSKIVNLYLSIEKNIGSETSARNIEGDIQKIRQLMAEIYNSLDLCYTELWRIDKQIPAENMPNGYVAINNIPFTIDADEQAAATGDGTLTIDDLSVDVLADSFHGMEGNPAWIRLQEALANNIRTDSRVPYVDIRVPIERPNNVAVPDQDAALTNTSIFERSRRLAEAGTAKITGWLWDRTGALGDRFGQIVNTLSKPEFVEFSAPDFKCSLDSQLLDIVSESCNGSACIENVVEAYENYHCISRADRYEALSRARIGRGERLYNQDMVRELRDNPRRAISPAYYPGRVQIGTFDWYDDAGAEIFPESRLGGLTSLNALTIRDRLSCEEASRTWRSFNVEVLGSDLSCDNMGGALIHTEPPIPDIVREDGLGPFYWPYAQMDKHIFPGEYNDPNISDHDKNDEPNIQRRFNYSFPITIENLSWSSGNGANENEPLDGYYPIEDRTYPQLDTTSLTIYSIEVFKEHTESRLYCRHRSILFRPILSFNKLYDVRDTDGRGQDSWWTGEFNNSGNPQIKDIGGKERWGEVQNCADWTVSDIATYLNYPKQEI